VNRFRKRHRFRKFATIVRDASNDGDEQPDYSDHFRENVPCNVFDVRGAETFRARQISAEVTQVVTMRYVEGLRHDMRINVGDRRLNIVSILDKDGVERFHEVDCSEVRE